VGLKTENGLAFQLLPLFLLLCGKEKQQEMVYVSQQQLVGQNRRG